MSAVKEPATLRPDVETIMRRLKGENTPSSTYCNPIAHSEIDQLKTLVKTLGNRLKGAYEDLAIKKETLSRLETEAKKTDDLQKELATKNEALSQLYAQEEIAQNRITDLEQQVIELKSQPVESGSSQETVLLREEAQTFLQK
jgi:ABC-type enterochelin transport system substrate-binding protein